MTADEPLNIRPAVPDDVPLILSLIRELAEYERLLHKVEADETTIRRTLFGPRPAARVLIADWRDQPAGFALFFEKYSTFLARRGIHLEDIYVQTRFRGRGIGRALLAHLAKWAVTEGYCRLDWTVLTWNVPAIRFYERLGARELADWTIYRLEGEGLAALASE